MMSKLKEILEFIMTLLGLLLNIKKKKTDEGEKKPVVPRFKQGPPVVQPEGIGAVSGSDGAVGLVGGPFRDRPGLYRSAVDTLGVRTCGKTHLSSVAGWALMAYAAGSCLMKMLGN